MLLVSKAAVTKYKRKINDIDYILSEDPWRQPAFSRIQKRHINLLKGSCIRMHFN